MFHCVCCSRLISTDWAEGLRSLSGLRSERTKLSAGQCGAHYWNWGVERSSCSIKFDEDSYVHRAVDEEPHYVSETVVPTTSQLEALKRHIATTKALKIKRLGEFTETKLLIIQVPRVYGSDFWAYIGLLGIPSGRRLRLVKLDLCSYVFLPQLLHGWWEFRKKASSRQLRTLK